MNPTEIYDALCEIAAKPFNATDFPFDFALAVDVAQAAVAKLRNGSSNKSDIPNGVLLNQKFHYAPAEPSQLDAALVQLKASKKNAKAKPAILITCDGIEVAAFHPASDESLHCKFTELGDNFGFFLPAAGKERYKAVEENPVDIKATGKLARLYDALLKANPDWATEDRRRDMSQLMMRLIFCMFAEDVGIFPENQFSKAIFNHAGNNGEEARETIIAAFRAMNLRPNERQGLPAWTHEFEYVNGGLFAGEINAPKFDAIAYRYLKEAAALNWREINPDIFGSMIQSVADPKQRAELGMHYTSVPNIMKVIGPLFLDDIDAEIVKAWDKPKALHKLLQRLENIRVFDPACGSGNFLVVAYRQLREREMRILKRLEELEGAGSLRMFSAIAIKNFYGIEITDFGVETAKLALFIAEYQANAVFAAAFGRTMAALPLKDAANIVHGNALRLDWEQVCPPPQGDQEVYIAGNPPFLGKAKQEKSHKEDMDFVYLGKVKSYRAFDLVTAWFYKAAAYMRVSNAESAFVATNSICQGASASTFWPEILKGNIEISFAHRSFKWSNNAASNAGVICVVVGIRNKKPSGKAIYDNGVATLAENINAYLLPGPNIFIKAESKPTNSLPEMVAGDMPRDGGHLLMDQDEKDELLYIHPEASKFIRRFVGSDELIYSLQRYCIYVDERLSETIVEEAKKIPDFSERFERVRMMRLASTNGSTNKFSERSHRFVERRSPTSYTYAILIPSISSENRDYLPVEVVGPDTLPSNKCFAIYEGPKWVVALIGSRLHWVWADTACGKIKSDFQYSNTLGWNTFPVPDFNEEQLIALSVSARKILKTRYGHYPKTIDDLYDPEKMPDDLRAVHRENDELLESMYIGRPFRNDTERLEHLFQRYADKMKTLNK